MNQRRSHRPLSSLLAVTLLAAACTGDRDRPEPTGPSSLVDLDLTVELVSPTTDQSPFLAGRNLTILVRAAEPGRRLKGLGYLIMRPPFSAVFQSDEIGFPPTTDEEHTFTFTLPADLPDNTLLNVHGFSVGQGEVREVTEATPITVVQCNGAPWCS